MTRSSSSATLHREIEWDVSDDPVPYIDSVTAMESRVALIAEGKARERIWLLEHPACYTVGTSAKPGDLLANRFPTFATGRGGRVTYHGPGQRVIYVMLDLRRRFGGDVRAFVRAIERALILSLAEFGIEGGARRDRVGVWTPRPELGANVEEKIAAIGLRVRRGVSFHGASLNVSPDLGHYAGIIPCGLADHGVTSLAALGRNVTLREVDRALRASFACVFEPMEAIVSRHATDKDPPSLGDRGWAKVRARRMD